MCVRGESVLTIGARGSGESDRVDEETREELHCFWSLQVEFEKLYLCAKSYLIKRIGGLAKIKWFYFS